MEAKLNRITDAWSKSGKKASILINLTIDDNLIVHVKNFITAIETWQALREIHEQHKITSKLYLLRKQYSAKVAG